MSFLGGTSILSSRGYIDITDIDVILINNGQKSFSSLCKNEDITVKNIDSYIEIESELLPHKILCTDEVKFLTFSENDGDTYTNSNDLNTNLCLGIPIVDYKCYKIPFSDPDNGIFKNYDFWYIVGFLIGNGSKEECTRNGYEIQFTVNKYLFHYKHNLLNNKALIDISYDYNHIYLHGFFTTSNKTLIDVIRKFYLFDTFSYILKDIEIIKHFLRGLENSNELKENITTYSSQFAFAIQLMYAKLGQVTGIKYTVQKTPDNTREQNILIYSIVHKNGIIKNNILWSPITSISIKNKNNVCYEINKKLTYIVGNVLIKN